jgi:hypothetical protein
MVNKKLLFAFFLESSFSAFPFHHSRPLFQILALVPRAVGFTLRSPARTGGGLGGRACCDIQFFLAQAWEQTFVNKPDRAK